MKRSITTSILCVFLCSLAAGQEEISEQTAIATEIEDTVQNEKGIRHEISIGAYGGLSSLFYMLKGVNGQFVPGFGGGVGVDYAFGIIPKGQIIAGVEISYLSAAYKIESGEFSSDGLTDSDNDNFTLYSNLSNYKEKQEVFLLQIPVKFRYTTDKGLFCAAGIKVNMLLHGVYKGQAATFSNKSYYDYPYGYSIDLNNFEQYSQDNNYKAWQVSASVVAEVGYKHTFRTKNINLSLYSGGYVEVLMPGVLGYHSGSENTAFVNCENGNITLNSVENTRRSFPSMGFEGGIALRVGFGIIEN
jgi:hypothetical protein